MNPDLKILATEPVGYAPEALGIYMELGQVEEGPFTRAEVLEKIGTVQVLVVRLGHQLDAEIIERGEKLLAIVSPTTGLDHIDLETAKKRGIEVISLKGETEFLQSIPATAELSWGLLLSATRHIPAATMSAREGCWDRDQFIGIDLKGKTLGIMGMGRIGEKIARYALAFEMNVMAYDPFREGWIQGVKQCSSLEALLTGSDVVMIHVPLNPGTVNLIGKKEFSVLRRGCVLINTSRGGIIDETELIKAMENGTVASAALDVIQAESSRGKKIESPLVNYGKTHTNLILTPHIGGATVESMHATEVFVAEKLKAWMKSRRDQ